MTLAERTKMPSESETPANAAGVGQPMREASLAAPNGYAAGDDYDDEGSQEWDEPCGQCGGDGWIMLSDAGPSEWGEDCFCEVDRPIECPECREQRQYEARERAKAKRHTDAPGERRRADDAGFD